jgi:hypothetical protein
MLQDNRSVGEGRVIVLPILLFNACHSGYLECQIDDDVTVIDSHTTYGTIIIQKHPSFHSRSTPMPTFGSFQFPFSLQKGPKPIYDTRDSHG